MNMNLDEETKLTLLKVGKGIGEIEKVREVWINETCYNETYIDKLKLIPKGCSGGECSFTLFESEGINKPFKIKLESICAKEGMCEEFGESFECCLEWRAETDEEVLIKAEKEMQRILNKIASVTLERESRTKEERFEEIEVNI